MLTRWQHGMTRQDWFRTLQAPDDGAGNGGTPPAPDGATPPASPDPDGAKPASKDTFEKDVLPTLSPAQRAAYDERMKGLESALEKERADRKALDKKIGAMKDELRAELRLESAEARAKQLKDGESSKTEVDTALAELAAVKSQLNQRVQRDELSQVVRASGLGPYEDIVLQLAFGKPDERAAALESFKTVRMKDITEEVERRLPGSRPPNTPGVRPQEQPQAQLQYPSMKKP